MNINEQETKKILDQGMLTRSLIENEVVMKKCELYSEMANDPAIKSFFKDQAKGLEGIHGYIKNTMANLK